MSLQKRLKPNTTETKRAIMASFMAVLYLAFSAGGAEAIGCCEVLLKGKVSCPTDDASCISACFPMPDTASCKKEFPASNWGDGACSAQKACTGKAPQGCCVGKDKCFAGTSEKQCAYFDNAPFSKAPCNAAANADRCAGKIEDEPFVVNSTPSTIGAGDTSLGVTPSGDFVKIPTIIPKLAIQIPNVSFSEIQVQDAGGRKYIDVPYIAQWTQGVYSYVLYAVLALAISMISWGGIKWLTAGGDSARVSSAKTTITNSIVGLILAMGSYLILNTVNPGLVSLNPIRVDVVPRDIFRVGDYMAGNADAPGTLSEVGIEPGGSAERPTNLTIPTGSCPGRTRSYRSDGDIVIAGKRIAPKYQYTIQCGNQTIDANLIAKYMQEQVRTGIPAAAIMAQMMTEAGPCSVFNLFSGKGSTLNYNYGGIGCTARQVPDGVCPHVAFNHGAFDDTPTVGGSRGPSIEISSCKVFNGYLQACVDQCEEGPPNDYKNYDCGNCFPIRSHASTLYSGKEVWIPSIQCSKKFNGPQEFLNSHLSFVKYCLPYNDSVYKFAYCIGASTYAGVTGTKGLILAEIIERNCLCDPATDSLGCKRNLELEQKLAQNIIKKRNLYSGYGSGRNIDYAKIVADLAESTGGLLTDEPASADPSNDLAVPSENAPY